MVNNSITVVIPAFNCETYLHATLDSVLKQDIPPTEVIVVNDGSTDGTADVMKCYREQIRSIHQDNQGPAAARNTGLRNASGSVIAFLDADDLWPANHIRLLGECLATCPDIGIALGHIQHVHAASRLDRLSLLDEPFSMLHLGCALLRRSVFDTVGYLDPAMRFSEDVDWFMRARETGVQMVLRREVVLFYRRHESNMTNVRDFTDLDLLKALKKSIDRRKKEGRVAESLATILKYEELL